jgi:integrase
MYILLAPLTYAYMLSDFQTCTLSGIEFKPHDLRRTFITEALATGAPLTTVHGLAEASPAAGHAGVARKDLKLRYG